MKNEDNGKYVGKYKRLYFSLNFSKIIGLYKAINTCCWVHDRYTCNIYGNNSTKEGDEMELDWSHIFIFS